MDKTAAVDWHALRVFYFLRHWLNSFWGEFGFIFHKLFEMWVGWSSKWNDHWVKKIEHFLYLSTHVTENVGMFFGFFFLYKIYRTFYNKPNHSQEALIPNKKPGTE